MSRMSVGQRRVVDVKGFGRVTIRKIAGATRVQVTYECPNCGRTVAGTMASVRKHPEEFCEARKK